ncbi:MAG: hypothetical protein JXB03_04080 [Spirochaetales bacterium]|nr:hypothetical protein [Spirochaetales bacterium]
MRIIEEPTRIIPEGNKPKKIDEYAGRVNTGTGDVSIALMHSPEGWKEPGQTPLFDEYTVILEGCLRVETQEGIVDLTKGRGIIINRGEWVRYSTPHAGGARYVAVCLPAFSPDTVRRDTE